MKTKSHARYRYSVNGHKSLLLNGIFSYSIIVLISIILLLTALLTSLFYIGLIPLVFIALIIILSHRNNQIVVLKEYMTIGGKIIWYGNIQSIEFYWNSL